MTFALPSCSSAGRATSRLNAPLMRPDAPARCALGRDRSAVARRRRSSPGLPCRRQHAPLLGNARPVVLPSAGHTAPLSPQFTPSALRRVRSSARCGPRSRPAARPVEVRDDRAEFLDVLRRVLRRRACSCALRPAPSRSPSRPTALALAEAERAEQLRDVLARSRSSAGAGWSRVPAPARSPTRTFVASFSSSFSRLARQDPHDGAVELRGQLAGPQDHVHHLVPRHLRELEIDDRVPGTLGSMMRFTPPISASCRRTVRRLAAW